MISPQTFWLYKYVGTKRVDVHKHKVLFIMKILDWRCQWSSMRILLLPRKAHHCYATKIRCELVSSFHSISQITF